VTSAGAPTLGSSGPVPTWLNNLAAVSWRLVVVAVLGFVLIWIANVFFIVTWSVIVATLISVVCNPLMSRLLASGRSRNAAALLVFTVALLAIALLVVFVAIALLPDLVAIVRSSTSGAEQVRAWLEQASIPAPVSTFLESLLSFFGSAAGTQLAAVLGSLASAATILLLAIFLVFFFVRDGYKAWNWIFQNVDGEEREHVDRAGRNALDRVAGSFAATTKLAIVAGLTTFAFMLLLGLPLALSTSLLVFLIAYIPYFGGPIGSVFVFLIALGEGGAFPASVIFVLMAIRAVIVHFYLRPVLRQRDADIHPVIALVALVIGYQLAGIVGLVVVIPITAALLSGVRAAQEILEPTNTEPLPSLVPGWLDTMAQYSARALVVIILFAIVVVLVNAMPLVVVPLVGALILAATLDRIVAALTARGWNRTVAAAVSVGGGLFSIAALVVLAAIALPINIQSIADAVTGGAGNVSAAVDGQLGVAEDVVEGWSASTVQAVLSFSAAIAGVVLLVAVIALLGFYFLRDGGWLWGLTTARLQPDAANEVRYAGRRAFDALGGYMLGTAAVSFVGAATQWLIMVLLGLPYALPVFVLSFILCFIPYLGGYLTTGIALLITINFGSPLAIAIMVVWTAVFNIVQGNVLAPVVYGRTVSIHPAIVLLAVPAGGAVAGIAGMFLAVPVAGVIAGTWRPVLRVFANRFTPTEPSQGAVESHEGQTSQPSGESQPAGAT
jgi:predicted PurR-regulated permease PerM